MHIGSGRSRGICRVMMARLSVVVAVSLFASMVAAGPVAGQEDTGAGFSDVTGGVHKPAIDALAAMGVFEGTECAEGMFCPDGDMKRWTMGVWLVRILDEEEPAAVSESSFADVDYITQLRPGDNVYWMGMERILDGSNPANQQSGNQHSQRSADGTGGYASVGVDQCPSAADELSGRCKIGWVAADILVTANSDFLAANPAAEALFEAVKLSVIDVSLANVAMGEGRSPTYLAAQWIADNRALVDQWITAARAAA